MDNERCKLIRSSIESKIEDLEKRTTIAIDNLNDKFDLSHKMGMDLLRESISNINDLLDDMQERIKELYSITKSHKDHINGFNIDKNDVNNTLKKILDTIEDMKKCIEKVESMDKMCIKESYKIEYIDKEIHEIKEKLSHIEEAMNDTELKKLPKVLSLYDSIIKYKYIIVGIVLLFVISGGTDSLEIIKKIMTFLGI